MVRLTPITMRQGKGYLNLNYLFLLDWNQRTWLRKEHVILYMTQDRPRIPYSMKCFNVEKLCKFMQCHSNTQENMISVVCISAWNCLKPGAWPEIRLAGKGNHYWKGPKKIDRRFIYTFPPSSPWFIRPPLPFLLLYFSPSQCLF